MKVGDWFTVRDWSSLLVEEQISLLRYLQIIGANVFNYWFDNCGRTYDIIEPVNECMELDVSDNGDICLFYNYASQLIPEKQLSLNDLKRMAELANFS